MTEISKILPHAAKQVQTASTDKQKNPDSVTSQAWSQRHALMTRLWGVMSSTFLHKWTVAGDIDGGVFNDWMDGLGDLTPEEVRVGVLAVRELAPNANDEVWPPDLPEFRAMCRPPEDSSRVQTYSNRNFTAERLIEEKASAIKSLEQFTKVRRGDSEVAKREKKRMAAILRGEEVETKEESYRNLGLNRRWGPLP